MKLPFEADAATELEEAALLYERERPGHGELFVDDVAARVERAARFPRSGRVVADFEPERDVRASSLHRFPFSVVTAIVLGRHAVVAVAHERRTPGYWRQRID